MNILISQLQGETFAALSLQLLPPNTQTHTQMCASSPQLLPTAAPTPCIPAPACLSVRVHRQGCSCFTRGEKGAGRAQIIPLLAFTQRFPHMLIAAWVFADVFASEVFSSFSAQWVFLLSFPRVHRCSGPGLCPQPAAWGWEVGGGSKQNKESETWRSCCNSR